VSERHAEGAELEEDIEAYAAAFAAWEESGESAAWDTTSADGLEGPFSQD
jgi:hypothetical protein